MRRTSWTWLIIFFVGVVALPSVAGAGEDGWDESKIIALDTVWVLIDGFLVFFMQAGFGMVEVGFIRAKNACNILTKNFLDYCTASIMFSLVGYALMFGEGNGFMGFSAFGLSSRGGCPSNLPV